MSAAEFSRYSELINEQCGIKMPPSKKIMLEARLQKRLRACGIASYGAYLELLQGTDGRGELVHMIDAVTTNKTDFFREPAHFQYLTSTVLPSHSADNARRTFLAWSAGCSTGEEPYTLAMVLSGYAEQHPPFRFSILATDISTRVLDRAREAVYEADRAEGVPHPFRQKYLLRSKDRSKNLVRIVPQLRSLVRFQRLNLLEESLHTPDPLDAIFCRNVIIYFERTVQEQILLRLCSMLRPGGHLFLGHSESIHGFSLPLQRIVSTVHRRLA